MDKQADTPGIPSRTEPLRWDKPLGWNHNWTGNGQERQRKGEGLRLCFPNAVAANHLDLMSTQTMASGSGVCSKDKTHTRLQRLSRKNRR